MRYPIIDWIDAKCRLWGYERRRAMNAHPPSSIAGRMDEPIGHGGMREPTEWLIGDALLVGTAINRALEDHEMPDKALGVLRLHYWPKWSYLAVKAKRHDILLLLNDSLQDRIFPEIRVSHQGYYYLLSRAHHVIERHWPTDMEPRIEMAS